MNRERRVVTGRVRLSDISDEDLAEFMDSVETDDDYSSDDTLDDPNYEPEAISAEDAHAISQCLHDMDHQTSDMFIANAVNLSLNLSGMDLPSASSTAHFNHSAAIVAAEETVSTEEEQTVEPIPSTSFIQLTSTPAHSKRPRSPLPSIETTGPVFVPSRGGSNFLKTHQLQHNQLSSTIPSLKVKHNPKVKITIEMSIKLENISHVNSLSSCQSMTQH